MSRTIGTESASFRYYVVLELRNPFQHVWGAAKSKVEREAVGDEQGQ
jgi:hypothetical protein